MGFLGEGLGTFLGGGIGGLLGEAGAGANLGRKAGSFLPFKRGGKVKGKAKGKKMIGHIIPTMVAPIDHRWNDGQSVSAHPVAMKHGGVVRHAHRAEMKHKKPKKHYQK